MPRGLYGTVAALAAIAALLAFILVRKGRKRPGDHVFRASRWSHGNHVLPAQVIVTSDSITLYQPQWIGRMEESIHMAHISSIKIDTNIIFADVCIETSGGRDPIVCHGHTKRDAIEMKRVIEQYQTARYSPRTDTGA